MRVNSRAWRHGAILSTAQGTARYSRSVGDFFSSVRDHRWLAYARVFSTISWIWIRTPVKKGKRGACQQKAATVLPNRTAAA